MTAHLANERYSSAEQDDLAAIGALLPLKTEDRVVDGRTPCRSSPYHISPLETSRRARTMRRRFILGPLTQGTRHDC
jgi:hypothetical protein